MGQLIESAGAGAQTETQMSDQEMDSLLEPMRSDLMKRYRPEDLEAFGADSPPAGVDKESICSLMIEMLEWIFDLPQPLRGKVLRAFAADSPKTNSLDTIEKLKSDSSPFPPLGGQVPENGVWENLGGQEIPTQWEMEFSESFILGNLIWSDPFKPYLLPESQV